jgi:AcrR family transcriptional regulator
VWQHAAVAEGSDETHPLPRRGRPGYDADTVLRRAVALFIRQGYDRTSVGDLATELGLTKSAIYHHVASKESLLAAALDEALDGLEAAIAGALTGGSTSAYDRLRVAVRASVEVLVEHLPAVTLLLRVRGNSPVELAALERRRLLDEQLAGLVRAAVDEGSLRADLDPELVSRLVFGMVNSLVEWYRPDGPLDPAHLADALVGMAFDGLQAQGG